jgi:hypothetical protein
MEAGRLAQRVRKKFKMRRNKMKIAEALVLRKHLSEKVDQLKPLKVNGDAGVYEAKVQRVKVSEEIDEVKLQVPKLELKDITAEYDKYSKALRELDTAIQAANWQYDIEFEPPKDLAV